MEKGKLDFYYKEDVIITTAIISSSSTTTIQYNTIQSTVITGLQRKITAAETTT